MSKYKIIEVGSIVRLKSGGPKMTALRISDHDPENWDFLFFYDESHGAVEPKVLHNIPGDCVDVLDEEAE